MKFFATGLRASKCKDCSNEEDIGYVDLKQLNLPFLRAATDNFSEENKLGKGGFGEVFKGTIQSGELIAVKRLSKHSSQGFNELRNELVLAAKLKHKNLAPLIGVWRKWKTGSSADVVDASLRREFLESEVLNCLEVGLLCVQENPADRLDASAVVLLLGSHNSTTDEARPEPSRPAFFFGGGGSGSLDEAASSGSSRAALIRDGQPPSAPCSENAMTISDFQPR
ncbi:hypothetical protein EJB05_57641, partial [Eragrostis curvula]